MINRVLWLCAVLAASSVQALEVPQHHVAGELLVKFAALDARVLLACAHHHAVACRAVNVATARVFEVTGVTLSLVSTLPLGWAKYRVDAGAGSTAKLDEIDTAHIAALLSSADKRAGIGAVALNTWKRAHATPNDTYFSLQWMIELIGANQAWDITTGSSSSRVGVVDTGTLTFHEDLVGKDVAGFDFISDSGNSNDGDGRDSDYTDPGDDELSFHGSHVAGTLLANGNNGIGIAGMSWGARLVTGRALGGSGGADDDIMTAVAWMVGDSIDGVPNLAVVDRPRVINMSIGGAGPCTSFEQDVVDFALQNGVVLVVSAGNDSGAVNSPANCSGTIAVAALNRDNARTGYSSFGPEIDVVAPGGEQLTVQEEGVLSLYADNPNDPYVFYQGTSQAAPHVSGTVSLMLEENPALSRDDIVALIASTGAASCDGCEGKPTLRADLLVQQAGDGGNTACSIVDHSGCSGAQQCIEDSPSHTACVAAGSAGEGDDCASDALVCQRGAVCLLGGGETLCYRRCDMGFGCGASQDCIDGGIFSYCDPIDANSTIGPGPGPDPGPDPAPGPCDARRGNLDCPIGQGCVEDLCTIGADGDAVTGALCERDATCSSGLCVRGVCSTACSATGQCREGYSCDTGAIPGDGLCRADNCEGETADFCGDGWSCQASSDGKPVCAKGASDVTCTSTATHRGAHWPGAVALLLLLGFFRAPARRFFGLFRAPA